MPPSSTAWPRLSTIAAVTGKSTPCTSKATQPLTPEERAAGKKPWVYIGVPAQLENLICDRHMDTDRIVKIDNAVREKLASDREDAAEARYEARRDDRMMGY